MIFENPFGRPPKREGSNAPWVTVYEADLQHESGDGLIHFKGWISSLEGRPRVAVVVREVNGAQEDAPDRWTVFVGEQPPDSPEPAFLDEKQLVRVGYLGLKFAKETGRPYLNGPVLGGWGKVYKSEVPKEGRPGFYMLLSKRAYRPTTMSTRMAA